MVALPDDLATPIDDTDTVDTLTACLPRVLSELSPDATAKPSRCATPGSGLEEPR